MSTSTETKHRWQIMDYPKDARVEAVHPISCHVGVIPTGTKGTVSGHCDDGRAYVFFDGYDAGHTFHYPNDVLRVVERPPDDPIQLLATQLESQASTLARVVGERDRLRRALVEVAIPSLRYCEQKYDHDNQARLNLEAALKGYDTTTTGQEEG